MLELRDDLRKTLTGGSERSERELFDTILELEGESFRAVARRRTIRIVHAGRAFFAKIHRGVGWGEILKNLLSFRFPILGARTERNAILRLKTLGVPTMTLAGFGERGANPATRESFLITEELAPTLSLEDLCRDWNAASPRFEVKRALIREVARISRTLHRGGVNHRDFYICHFLLDQTSPPLAPRLHVIDLHRAQLRSRTPRRWILKDLGGLWFSAMDAGLTRADLLRFVREYSGCSIRDILSGEVPRNLAARPRLWRDVEKIAVALYKKVHRRPVGEIQNPFRRAPQRSDQKVTIPAASSRDVHDQLPSRASSPKPNSNATRDQKSMGKSGSRATTTETDGQSWAA